MTCHEPSLLHSCFQVRAGPAGHRGRRGRAVARGSALARPVRYCCERPGPEVLLVGALHRKCAFAFPPRSLLLAFVAKARADGPRGIVIAPLTPLNRRGRQWLTVVAGQQDRCLILPYTAAYVREGEEPGGAKRLAIPKSVVYIVRHIVSLRLALRAPVLFRGAVPVGMVFRVYRSSANCTSLACPAPLCVFDSWVGCSWVGGDCMLSGRRGSSAHRAGAPATGQWSQQP
jgi:hypothetical protein